MTPEQIVEMTDKITRSLNAGETLDATKIAPMNVPIIEVERLIKDIQRNQVTQTAVAVMESDNVPDDGPLTKKEAIQIVRRRVAQDDEVELPNEDRSKR